MKLWTPEEDRLLAMLHKEHNGHWNDIIKNMPGRICLSAHRDGDALDLRNKDNPGKNRKMIQLFEW